MNANNVIFPLSKQHLEAVFSSRAPFIFKHTLPNKFDIWTKIYFYENAGNGGSKMIVGEAYPKQWFKLTNDKGQFPLYGSYYFVDYYCNHILKDFELAKKFRECKLCQLSNYRFGSQLPFALSDYCMNYIRSGIYPPSDRGWDNAYNQKDEDKANKIIDDCDKWLENMGFYNVEYGVSDWYNAIELHNVKKYDIPIPLSEFKSSKGEPIKQGPARYVYCYNEKLD